MKMDRPNLKALKELLKEVGQLNLYYKIMQSQDKEDFKSNVKYAVKSLTNEAESLGAKGIERDLRKYANQISNSEQKAQVLALIDELFEDGSMSSVIDQMTKAFLNKEKKRPALRFRSQKSKVKKHSKFPFSQMTAKALSR